MRKNVVALFLFHHRPLCVPYAAENKNEDFYLLSSRKQDETIRMEANRNISRQSETVRDSQDSQRDSQRDSQKDSQRDNQRDRKTVRETDSQETERQRDRQTDSQKDRERQKDRESVTERRIFPIFSRLVVSHQFLDLLYFSGHEIWFLDKTCAANHDGLPMTISDFI